MSDSLSSWTKTNFTTLYETSSNTLSLQLDQSFDSVFSSMVEVFVNHVPTTRDQLKQSIRDRGSAATRAAIEWKDIVEVSEGDVPQEGVVAGSFVVTRSLKFRIRAAPAQTNNQTVFSARITQDPAVNDGDRRRIVQLFITSVDKAAPIRLQGSPDT